MLGNQASLWEDKQYLHNIHGNGWNNLANEFRVQGMTTSNRPQLPSTMAEQDMILEDGGEKAIVLAIGAKQRNGENVSESPVRERERE